MNQNTKPRIMGLTQGQLLGALGALFVFIGGFLDWVVISASSGTISQSKSYSGLSSLTGLQNYYGYINEGGIFTILISIIVLGIIFSDRIEKVIATNSADNIFLLVRRFSNFALLLFGIIIVLIAAINMDAIGSFNSDLPSLYGLFGIDSNISVSVGSGIGLYLTLIGGLGLLLSGFLGLRSTHSQTSFNPVAQQYPPQYQQYAPVANPAPQNQQYPPQYQQYPPVANPAPPTNPVTPQQTQAPSFCPNCGSAIEGTVYCGKCGSKVR